jgi:uncharacterized membrane protein (Fun14 family)
MAEVLFELILGLIGVAFESLAALPQSWSGKWLAGASCCALVFGVIFFAGAIVASQAKPDVANGWIIGMLTTWALLNGVLFVVLGIAAACCSGRDSK